MIQLREQFTNRHVEFVEREELSMSENRDDPTLCELHGAFHLGFVTGLVRPCGHDAKPQCNAKL